MSAVPPVTPQAARISSSAVPASSPHYTTTRRHSLYGTEDRIVIDPGSRVWKVGFSGEGRPREVFAVSDPRTGAPLWPDFSGRSTAERDDALITMENRLQDILRKVFFELLLADPKARKVVLVENPLLPIAVKDSLVRVLFLNLLVPSVSFAPSHLLALIATGRLSGLVLDCGYVDTVSLPIFGSRPLFTSMRSTPVAGMRLNAHIRSLILKYARYTPPMGVVSSAVPQATAVPDDVLTDSVLEDIKTRMCFVSEPLLVSSRPNSPIASTTQDTTGTGDESQSDASERERSSSSTSMRMDIDPRRRSLGSQPTRARVSRTTGHLRDHYMQQSNATELALRIPGPATVAPNAIVSRATLTIPGWVRERAAEMLFDSGDLDESGCAELILDSLLKTPVDLRKELAGSIVVSGGTSMLPGFITRLHMEIIRLLEPPPDPYFEDYDSNDDARSSARSLPLDDNEDVDMDSPSPTTPRAGASFATSMGRQSSPRKLNPLKRKRIYDPYAPLRPLAPFVSILNDPNPPTTTSMSSAAMRNAGKAPGFAPAALAWVGGSLTGSLRSGGDEIVRDQWEEQYEDALLPTPPPSPSRASPAPGGPGTPPPAAAARTSSILAATARKIRVDMPGGTAHLLPDWSKPPMRQGAPSVFALVPASAP
ncbi:actin-like ATPase domain-containing protein [Clavulina sp. PMI_390]|nr:actin-like ATPase domain-containing protein [Clavulina sp. PMI_390]